MTNIYNIQRMLRLGAMLLLISHFSLIISSCSDDPDGENYYIFKGEMMGDYIKTRPQYSMFAEIVNRAGLMSQLSTYGAYTCFLPNDSALSLYLDKHGKQSLADLTDADCDTIARTHLVNNMYTTHDMQNGVLASANMNRRYLEVGHTNDENGNPVVIVNRQAKIFYELQNDSVMNGVVQPVDCVLESSNRMLPDVIDQNPRTSIFNAALRATGLRDSLFKYKDTSYDPTMYGIYTYVSNTNKEAATVPDEKTYGYTVFLVPDDVLSDKYQIPTSNTDVALRALYELACSIYDPVYPNDVESECHSFEHITDRRNPLNRFMAYHILDRNAKGINFLTPKYDVSIITNKMNPFDWYTTMLPHTLIKFEKLTVMKWQGDDQLGERYINRRYDDLYQIHGTHIQPTVESEYTNDAINGCYFYIDDYIAFSQQMRDEVCNCRIRMDFATVFPELMTNDIRLNGTQTDMKRQDPDFDVTHKYGRNYYFPEGYLDGVKLAGTAYLVYRRPHDYYWNYQGDEMNIRGNFDFEFRLPPVPVEGDYQIRIGYPATATRGIAQIYLDGNPQGIPLDMRKGLNDPSILGSNFKIYTDMTEAQKQEDRKILKNLGYYRAPSSTYCYNGAGSTVQVFYCNVANVLRIVLCTTHMKPGEDHYLRIRAVSEKQGNDNEFMLDYLELVPKSVYGVSDGNAQEDDL